MSLFPADAPHPPLHLNWMGFLKVPVHPRPGLSRVLNAHGIDHAWADTVFGGPEWTWVLMCLPTTAMVREGWEPAVLAARLVWLLGHNVSPDLAGMEALWALGGVDALYGLAAAWGEGVAGFNAGTFPKFAFHPVIAPHHAQGKTVTAFRCFGVRGLGECRAPATVRVRDDKGFTWFACADHTHAPCGATTWATSIEVWREQTAAQETAARLQGWGGTT